MTGLVSVVDDTPEGRLALRFAARRAAATGVALTLVHVVPPADFVQWGAVQEVMAAEAHDKADALLAAAAAEVEALTGTRPAQLIVRHGKPAEEVAAVLADRPGVAALVLGAAAKGAPGPLVAAFAGEGAGARCCPLIIVPGGLDEAAIDRLA